MEASAAPLDPRAGDATWDGPQHASASPRAAAPFGSSRSDSGHRALVSDFAKKLFSGLFLPLRTGIVHAAINEPTFLADIAPRLAQLTMVGPEHEKTTEFLPRWLRPTTNMTLADLVIRVSRLISGGHIDPSGEDGEDQPLALGFRKAIEHGNWGVVAEISTLGPELTRYDEYGLHPVHHLVLSGNFESVGVLEKLKEAGADLNARTEAKDQAFDRVNEGLGLGVTRTPVPKNEHPLANMFEYRGYSALHLAVIQRNPVFVGELVRLGCDFEAKDAKGCTPLFNALDSGYDPYFTETHHKPYSAEIVDILLEAGADLNTVAVGTYGGRGRTLWDEVVFTKNAEGADRLTREGLPPTNPEGDCGPTPLHRAIVYCRDEDDMADRVIAAGADPEAKCEEGLQTYHEGSLITREDVTPLHLAAYYNKPRVLELLLSHGVAADPRDSFGYTPLLLSVGSKDWTDPQIFDELHKRGADLNAVDNKGNTALWYATRYGKASAAKQLLDLGADPRLYARGEYNPLHYALQWRKQCQQEVSKHRKDGDFESDYDSTRERALRNQREFERWEEIVDKIREAKGGKSWSDSLTDLSQSVW